MPARTCPPAPCLGTWFSHPASQIVSGRSACGHHCPSVLPGPSCKGGPKVLSERSPPVQDTPNATPFVQASPRPWGVWAGPPQQRLRPSPAGQRHSPTLGLLRPAEGSVPRECPPPHHCPFPVWPPAATAHSVLDIAHPMAPELPELSVRATGQAYGRLAAETTDRRLQAVVTSPPAATTHLHTSHFQRHEPLRGRLQEEAGGQ